MDLWDLLKKKVDTKRPGRDGNAGAGWTYRAKNDITGFVLVFCEETTGRFISTVPVYAERNGSIQAA